MHTQIGVFREIVYKKRSCQIVFFPLSDCLRRRCLGEEWGQGTVRLPSVLHVWHPLSRQERGGRSRQKDPVPVSAGQVQPTAFPMLVDSTWLFLPDFMVLKRNQAHQWNSRDYAMWTMPTEEPMRGIWHSLAIHYYSSNFKKLFKLRETSPLYQIMERKCLICSKSVPVRSKIFKKGEKNSRRCLWWEARPVLQTLRCRGHSTRSPSGKQEVFKSCFIVGAV